MADIFLPTYCKNENTDILKVNQNVNCEKGDNQNYNSDMENSFMIKCREFCQRNKNTLIDDVNLSFNTHLKKIGLIAQNKLGDTDFKGIIETHDKVFYSGQPNFLGCKIPVKSGINVGFFRENLIDYKDNIICEFLEYGAPVGFEGKISDISSVDIVNHKGALEFDMDVLQYLYKEASYGAIIGPFDQNPFCCDVKISPLNTVSKKDSDERRIILDLSFPPGASVNDFIDKEFYLGEYINLIYPKVDDLVEIIKEKGGKCLVFKKDLKRYYRQIPIDPGDLHLIGFQWGGKMILDRVVPMGLRTSALICQRITSAVTFMFAKLGYSVVNYIDDFGGADTIDKADQAYNSLGMLLQDCGLEVSESKCVAPTTRMEFLGIMIDTVKLTLEVTPERVSEISLLVEAWLRKKKASLKDLQSLLGKLFFIATCVRPGRIFVSRLLNWLRQAFPSNITGNGHKIFRRIPSEVHKDLLWWHKFLHSYNGISIMFLEEWSRPDEVFSSDACLQGFGAISSNQFFHGNFPPSVVSGAHINGLELFAIVLAVKVWGYQFHGKKIMIFCDNEASVQVINSGSSKDSFMQNCLRELCYVAAIHEFQIRARHIEGDNNRLADCLSRWDMDKKYPSQFLSSIDMTKFEEVSVSESQFTFQNEW